MGRGSNKKKRKLEKTGLMQGKKHIYIVITVGEMIEDIASMKF